MIFKVKKRTLFFVGLVVTSLVQAFSQHLRSNFSKEESLLLPTAHADAQIWNWGDGGGAGGAGGDGCGGCSGGDSAK
jgi:hypothetical protein